MSVMVIVAIAENDVIGRSGAKLPWHLRGDILRFKELTTDNTVVMGRATYETLGKPLPDRTNVVVSRQLGFEAPGCVVVHTLERALQMPRQGDLFIIGGAQLYERALPFAQKVLLTRVHGSPDGDVHLRFDDEDWIEVSRERHEADEQNEYAYSFIEYVRKEHAA